MNPILTLKDQQSSKAACMKELEVYLWSKLDEVLAIRKEMGECQKDINDLQIAIEKLTG